MKKLFTTLLITFLISNCTSISSFNSRTPASSTDKISYYLAVDKFNYYINEYSIAQEGKVPEEIIAELRSIDVQKILALKLSIAELEDANNYDEIIYQYLKAKNLIGNTKKESLKWNYNFFRNKLNEAFTITPSKLDMNLVITAGESATERELPVEKALYAAHEMTLDSGHYISNRTTRAIFWEGIESNRTFEFHLGDSREFLKTLKAQGGEILFEVRPLAKNYNKIFLVKYPGENDFRYAITNIGGHDRLNHLTNQLNLSNLSSGKLKTKVVIKGDLEKFHNSRTEEHILQLKHLPKANRVIIGQKESIDGKFNIFWKMKAIRSIYDEDPSVFNKIDKTQLDKFFKLEDANFEQIFKDKKIVEDIFSNFENYFLENPEKAPAKFKIFNYDNFTIEMCDYVFKSKNGNEMRWRVVSNVWGDEIVPIARALKATGHTNVTYMGTAGAFADKGYKVGDLVIPDAVVDQDKKLVVKSNYMKIEGAKYGGSVEHVGSPFEETTSWLAKARARSEFVEVETSYLRQIFNGPTDNVEMYLLISDILGSDTETLANATSGKRKNAQNKLLAELFKRDAGHIPGPANLTAKTSDEAIKNLIESTLAKKSAAYRYLVFSKLKGKKNITEEMIEEAVSKSPAFTDSFAIDRLVKAGEAVLDLKNKTNLDFEIAFNKSLIDGSWNPKIDKIRIFFIAKNQKDLDVMNLQIKKFETQFPEILKSVELGSGLNLIGVDMAKSKLPQKIDPDIMLKIYTFAGFSNAGLYKSITYNGNVTLDIMPTNLFELPKGVFEIGTKENIIAPKGANCSEAILSFLRILN